MGKFLFLALSLVFLFTIADSFLLDDKDDKDFASEERLWDLYKRWRSHYGISRDLEEDLKHFNVFKENAKYVHSYNKKGDQHRLMLNKFADMTDEEFMSHHCLGSIHHRMRQGSLCVCGTGNFLNEKMTDLPPSVDWREKDAVTEVKDQGEYCGEFSCRGVIDGHENVPANDEDASLKAVTNLPVSVAIDTMGSDGQFYSEGVFTRHCGTDLDHGVAIVGYGGSYPIKSSPNPTKEGVPPTKDEL